MSHHDEVLDVLAEVSGLEREQLRPEMDLVTDLKLDSPKALRLLVELEELLDTEIEDELAASFSTVGDILRFVQEHAH